MAALTQEQYDERADALGMNTPEIPAPLIQNPPANLSPQDRVNAAGRVATTPVGSDTSLALAAGMDRADLGNRFGFGSPQYTQGTEHPVIQPVVKDDTLGPLIERRNQILQNIDPDAPARYPDIHRRRELHDEALHTTGLMVHQQHQDFLNNEHLRVMTDTANGLRELGAIDAPLGSQDRFKQILGIRAKYPGLVESVAGRQALEREAARHDKEAQFQEKNAQLTGPAFQARVNDQISGAARALYPDLPVDQAIKQFQDTHDISTVEIGNAPHVTFKLKNETPEKQLKADYSLTKEQFLNAENVRAGKLVTAQDLKETPDLKNERGEKAKVGEFTNQYQGAETGPIVSLMRPDGKQIHMPRKAFEDYQKQLGATGTESAAHPQDNNAIAWAKSHPDDPRSKRILSLNQ